MIGYPAFANQGIIVRTVFDPTIDYGSRFKIKTSIKPVAEVTEWAVNQIDLALDTLVPKGQWMMTINAWDTKLPRPIPQQAP